MIKTLVVLLIGAIPACALAQAASERPSIHMQAARYVWTTEIDSQTRQFRNSVTGRTKPGPIYLWLSVQGDRAAFDWLNERSASGAMPIFMYWLKRDLDGYYSDPADVVQLAVGAKDQLQLLGSQLEQTGSFSWRVWAGKKSASRGTWSVRVVDAWGGYLTCPTELDAAALCNMEIEVRP